MILKPGDVVLFKTELTPQIVDALHDLGIAPRTFNIYKGTMAKVSSVFECLNGRQLVYIQENDFWWPSEVFEEDNEF